MQNDDVVITLQKEIHSKQMLWVCRLCSFFQWAAALPENSWDYEILLDTECLQVAAFSSGVSLHEGAYRYHTRRVSSLQLRKWTCRETELNARVSFLAHSSETAGAGICPLQNGGPELRCRLWRQKPIPTQAPWLRNCWTRTLLCWVLPLHKQLPSSF